MESHGAKSRGEKAGLSAMLMCALLVGGAQTSTQLVDVSGRVELEDGATNNKIANVSGAVVWLVPAQRAEVPTPPPVGHIDRLRLEQHNKSFEPSLLVVPVGSVVEFPNRDPFFHNVFSLFEGKRFDLGLYEAGTTRNVVFDRPGISYIFCNIHSEMSAVVIALETPYYGVSNPRGEILIPSVPSGRYVMHVWHQSSLPETLNGLTREVTISQPEGSLGIIRVAPTTLLQTHKNKYGRDYDPSTPTSPAYQRP
jgi:plastocyanin